MTKGQANYPEGDLQRRVIGYTRVSTKDQEADLKAQAEKIREACRQRGLTPVAIYEDVGSGMKPDAFGRLDGLRDAIEYAMQHRIPLIVTHRDRVSRVPAEAERITLEHGVEIICIEDGFVPLATERLPHRTSGHRFGEQVSKRTTAALKERRLGNTKLGNPDIASAQRQAIISNIVRFDDHVREIVAVLRAGEPERRFTAREIVEQLNKKGIRTGRGGLWTVPGIRRPLMAAREKIILEDEVAQELTENGFA